MAEKCSGFFLLPSPCGLRYGVQRPGQQIARNDLGLPERDLKGRPFSQLKIMCGRNLDKFRAARSWCENGRMPRVRR